MTLKKWAVRIVLFAGGLLLSLVLLTFLAVQIQQRVLRWRAERLSADMHQVRLYQSSWTDAQRLMHRWGAWGHYDGSCTVASCTYKIEMGSIAIYIPRVARHAWLDWLLRHDRFNLYNWFGGRVSAFYASFTVHNGTIWREDSWIGVSVPSRRMRRDNDFDRTLSVGAVSRQRLNRTLGEWGAFMGPEDELAGHPDYKVGRPGGCEVNCQIGVAYYSTHTPPAEIERLTSYDFSCFTRFHPCAELEDLLPAAKDWHLYKADELGQSSLPEKPCDVPVWALARDARYVLAVEALSTRMEKIEREQDWFYEADRVRVIASLKEPAPWQPGTVVTANPYARYEPLPPADAEHLVPGKRYLVFPVGNDRRDQLITRESPIRLDRCGVQDDTPENRRELEEGFAQNDTLNP